MSAGDLKLPGESEEKESEEENKEFADLLTAVQTAVGEQVANVKITNRLKSHPVCLSSEGALSIEMEKVLSQMPGAEAPKAQKVLEINPEHEAFNKLKAFYDAGDEDKARFEAYSRVLFGQALLMEGLELADPIAFANDVTELIK